ncbi:MAG: lysostaphin resistance A-like protein [Candidatus Sulfotelmatobacter sp.]
MTIDGTVAAQHALALFLFVGVPIWDLLETRALKTSPNPRRKISSYRRIVAIEWIAALAAWLLLRTELFYTAPSAQRSSLHKIDSSFIWGFVLALLVGSLLQAFLVGRNLKVRDKLLRAFRALDFILPVTREERAWFALVSITAGICEEILYRGFLIRYLSDSPWHTGTWYALGVSSLAFGMAHGYQGVKGIAGTAIIGAVMAVIFIMTGSLWMPMALHAAFDLRVLLLFRPSDLAA